MRTLITIAILVLTLAWGSFASYRYVETTTQTMGTLLESVEAAITQQKWEGAQELTNYAQQKWKVDGTWWSILLDHQEIDTIDINLERLGKFLAIQDTPRSLGEVTTLRLLFEHIVDMEAFTLENIL